MYKSSKLFSLTAIAMFSLTLAACGDAGTSGEAAAAGSKSAAGTSQAAQPDVAPTGKNVDIKMISDSKGERYDPVEIAVRRGDNLRFLLESGVHNVHFLPAKNPPGVKLPPMSEYLQLPGQKLEYLISFPPGRYYYQCDIHLALGMVGHVEVEDNN